MNNLEGKIENAVVGKTARACDICLRRRARWFCAADDAFLCQSCDSSVHSANQLASQHERVRLETSSLKGSSNEMNSSTPTWYQGFTRKARTPRKATFTKLKRVNHPFLLVPEMNGEDPSFTQENEDQLFFGVPVFDSIADDFCMVDGEDGGSDGTENIMFGDEEACNDLNLDKLLTGDAELELFGTDVESLLGMGVEKDSTCGINDLRMGEHEESEVGELLYGEKVKVKEEDDEEEEVQAAIACYFDHALDINHASSMNTWEDEEEMKMVVENKVTPNIGS